MWLAWINMSVITDTGRSPIPSHSCPGCYSYSSAWTVWGCYCWFWGLWHSHQTWRWRWQPSVPPVTLVELKPNVLCNPMNLCDLPWWGGGWGASWGFPWFARQGFSFVTRRRVSYGSDRFFLTNKPWRSKKFRQHQRGRQLAAPFDLKKP